MRPVAAERITQEQLEELEEIVFLSDFHYSKETGIRYWNWITVSTKWYMKHAQAKN